MVVMFQYYNGSYHRLERYHHSESDLPGIIPTALVRLKGEVEWTTISLYHSPKKTVCIFVLDNARLDDHQKLIRYKLTGVETRYDHVRVGPGDDADTVGTESEDIDMDNAEDNDEDGDGGEDEYVDSSEDEDRDNGEDGDLDTSGAEGEH